MKKQTKKTVHSKEQKQITDLKKWTKGKKSMDN